jgi:ABC-type nitrate/sulfonate/bicarbonate transport system permease component
VGRSARLRALVHPFVEIVRPIPPLAWVPLAILWFGIGDLSAAYIIFLGAFFPILLNTVSGVLAIERGLLEAAILLGASRRDLFLKVLAPGATPAIMTGVRIAVGVGWMTLVAAEFTGVRSGYGLGYLIMTARDIQRADLIVAGMFVIGLVGFAMDALIRTLERRLLRWR